MKLKQTSSIIFIFLSERITVPRLKGINLPYIYRIVFKNLILFFKTSCKADKRGVAKTRTLCGRRLRDQTFHNVHIS